MYDLSIDSFWSTFNEVLPEEYLPNLYYNKLKSYIEETLSRETHNLTAVEFGGPGSKLFTGFSKNFFKKTVGICLKDIRDRVQKETDTQNQHSVIAGDILDVINNELLNKVTSVLGTDKVDLIISRMNGPLNAINKNQAILDRIIRNWYIILNENGLMFIQFVYMFGESDKPFTARVKKWSEATRDRFPEIDIQIGKGGMRLHKKVGSPEKLPPATQLFN